MRRAQCVLITLAIVLPLAVAAWNGGGTRDVVIVLGSVAFAIYIGQVAFLLIIVLLAFKGLSAADIDVLALLFGTPGRIVIIAASLWAYFSWLRVPQKIEALSTTASHPLADSTHETEEVEELLAANEAFEGFLADILAPRQPEVLTPRRLWLGLGHDQASSWRANAIWVVIALIALALFHFWKNAHSDFIAYMTLSGIFAICVFGRIQGLSETWLRTAGEQSLLVLTPRWPRDETLRIVLLQSVWPGIPQLLVGWLVFSGAALALGWISAQNVALVAVGQLAVLVSSVGLFVSHFAHAGMRKTNWLLMLYLLTAAVGIVTLLISMSHGSMTGSLVGMTMFLAPTAVAFLAFFLRPVQFPVQVILRQ